MSVDAKQLAALPTPPFVHIEGIINSRALDTALASCSRALCPMRIVRAGDITRITPRGKEQLRALGIKRIFDMRSATERASKPAPTIDGVTVSHAVIFDWFSPEKMAEIFKELERDTTKAFVDRYAEMLENGKDGYGAILRHIRDRPQEGILFHCSAGKDRTGVIAALILALAGAYDEVIAADYALTQLGLAPYQSMIAAHFAANSDFTPSPENVTRMMSSEPETMFALLRFMRQKYGGAEGYCAKLGFSHSDVARMKANLIGSGPLL
ncbi:hypothetical protein AURDEDRAFT_187452 [Auricularia subglabra TFB-10046 SS5]|nr:hypothetical protein AURDEDRAFT_187452 [Auricularia subglabra TFB-10046 SS5]